MAKTYQSRLTIRVHPVDDGTASSAFHDGPAVEATLVLARLIGRQMAREQFARDCANESSGNAAGLGK